MGNHHWLEPLRTSPDVVVAFGEAFSDDSPIGLPVRDAHNDEF